MKLIVLLCIAALAAPVASAQETETPTAASSPAQSASPETNESPSAKSSSKQYPTPGTTASPAASTTSTPAKGTGASTAKPTSAAGPVVLKGNAEQQIRQIEDAYEAAMMAHNLAMIEPFMADDFVLTDSKNRVMNKRRAIAEFKKDTDTYTTGKNTELKLHSVARDVYVVTGVAHEAGKDKTGKPFDRRFRFTDTFVNRNGRWLVAATHVSTLSSR